MTEQEIREAICEVGHKLWQLGFVAANDGNISARLPDGNFITTPTGTSKAMLTPDMLIKMNADNEVVEPARLPGVQAHQRVQGTSALLCRAPGGQRRSPRAPADSHRIRHRAYPA